MYHYQLILDDLEPVSFRSSFKQLKNRLNSAYIKFTNKHNINSTLLYVHHPVQGWCQVCDVKNSYRFINNPLNLDYDELKMAIMHTLAQSSLMLDKKQKQDKKEKALQAERNIDAEIKRGAFHIVKSSRNNG